MPISQKDSISLLNRLIGIQVEGFYKQDNLQKYSKESRRIINTIDTLSYSALDVYYYFLKYWTEKSNKLIPCEQTPKNLYYLEEIINNFNNARVLNMVRDPRSILLSQKNKWKRRFLGERMPIFESFRAWSLYHPITIAMLWNSATNVIDKYHCKHVLTIKFEDFITDPERHLSLICNHCQINFSLDMLNVPQLGSSIGADDSEKFGIDKSKAFTWRNSNISNAELHLLQRFTKVNLQKFGYELEDIKPNYFQVLYWYVMFPVKISLSFMLNLGRMRNILETLKRRLG